MKPYYDQDGITIYHGDCADILPLVEPSTVALVLTDPPYGMGFMADGRNATVRSPNGQIGGEKQASSRDWLSIEGDARPFDPTPLLRYSRLILWGANWYADRLPPSGCWFVFNKRGDGLSAPLQGDCELAWSNLPSQRVHMFSHMWHGAPRWREEPVLHPNQKPTALMRWILDKWTQPGDLIFDPYMGSGPVAQACHEMGRRYIGVEIVEKYCEFAVKRLAQGVLAFGDP